MTRRKKQTGGNPARRASQSADNAALAAFSAWAEQTDELFADPETARAGMTELFALARRDGIDPLEPDGVCDLTDLLIGLGADDPETVDVLHDYVHFRLETSPDPEWETAHAAVEDLVEDGLPWQIADALDDEAALDPAAVHAALAETAIVAGVRGLLDWIGAGRAVTATGALRRADIAHAASLLGIRARGVAKLPVDADFHDGAHIVDGESLVLAMRDLPSLAAWWDGLDSAELIEVGTSRVRPGRRAAAWTAAPVPPREAADALVGVFVSNLLLGELGDERDPWGLLAFRSCLQLALAVLDPAAPQPAPDDVADELFRPRAERVFERLVGLGILRREGDRLHVPEALRGVFARGVLLAIGIGGSILDGDGAFADGGDDFDPFAAARSAGIDIEPAPGMAAELLAELAPLLLEEGVDLDDLGSASLDELNAALARANERRNLALFTPVGTHRAMALTTLRLTSEAFAEGGDVLVRALVESIRPEPDGNLPSIAQVIGVGLGSLDAWSQDARLAGALRGAQVPAWEAASTAAAREILRSARSAGAFDELHGLHLRFGGKQILEGTVLAVAAAVIAVADAEGAPVREVAGRLLAAD